MNHQINWTFSVPGDDFTRAGEASSLVKNALKKLGLPPEIIRKVAIAMYEGEINMVIHANGGKAIADIYVDRIEVRLVDTGKGIPDINQAMQPGFSTASEEIRDLGFGAGMGLPNMLKNTDKFDIRSTVGVGTEILLVVNFH